mmetsp:Transcript_34015/g.44916  ORF Transcript_34015/g.44916 Transcript_34015/m.44916 type:complete len:671 (-) Transcript_34015:267-2279(-)
MHSPAGEESSTFYSNHLTKFSCLFCLTFFFLGFFGQKGQEQKDNHSKIRGQGYLFSKDVFGQSYLEFATKQQNIEGTSMNGPIIKPMINFKADNDDQLSDLKLQIFNEYAEFTDTSSYPWEYLAEPYRPTTLRVVGDIDSNKFVYEWRINGHLQDRGQEIQAVFTSVGKTDLDLIEYKEDGEINRKLSVEVVVKYVRREIRELTDVDREMFFSAVMIMQRVPTEIGQNMYGEDYKDKDYFNRLHLYYGGARGCDHWHSGPGFVTSHMALTLEFEQALQAINPMVTVPYWDFTLESTFYQAEDFRNSQIFSDDWFGDADPNNGLRTVDRGRWAYVPTMTGARGFSDVVNSYGLLRAPWNNDPTPFLTRSATIYGIENNQKPSGCEQYHIALTKGNWPDLAMQLNSAAHGHIHELIGGAWHHYYGKDTMNDGETTDAQKYFSHEIQALSKKLWRHGYLNCPLECSLDTPADECMCTCSEKTLQGKHAYEILLETGILSTVHYYDMEGQYIESFFDEDGEIYYNLPGKTSEESAAIFKGLLRMVCNPGHLGDMFQGTSTNDILFWVLHPTVDRLWHHSRLGKRYDFDHEWPDDVNNGDCYCHRSEDIMPFKNIFSKDDRFLSNAELYELFDPAGDEIPYVYGHFKWQHCELLGYNMNNDQKYAQKREHSKSLN